MNRQLEQVFRDCFFGEYRTLLAGGAEEPLYRPAQDAAETHRIYYRADYFASALHEVAHWCIAGEERRDRLDYGYWYAPDGRDPARQREFERVEVQPQAIEWHFARACERDFRLSVDNLDGDSGSTATFATAVGEQARHYCQRGLPPRAEQFRRALALRFGGSAAPSATDFSGMVA